MVVVTGGGGFLGSILVPLLLKKGYGVRVFDRFFFGTETLSPAVGIAAPGQLELIKGDTRWLDKEILRGAFAVIDLAALSNDPVGELNQELTFDINATARARTATLAKEVGVERYILASSCSVYGFQDGMIEETDPLLPLTTYARANVLAEQGVLPLAGTSFSVTSLRQGTLFGQSPRMRFDLVVNIMTNSIFNEGKLIVVGGTQWRPLVHVEDSARAFIAVLEAPKEKVSGKIFNVGSTEQNYQMEDLGRKIKEAIPVKSEMIVLKQSFDARSYKVSSEKMRKELGFETKKTPMDGAQEIYKGLKSKKIVDDARTRTIGWYKELLSKDPDILNRELKESVTVSISSFHDQ